MKCGLYEHDITPALNSDIPGQLYRRKATGIRERLFVHAAYLENDDGEKAVVASVDVILLPDAMADDARSEISEKLAMPKEHVLLAATHSHTAGPVWTWGDFATEDPAYISFLKSRIIDAAMVAAQHSKPVTLRWGQGHDGQNAHYRDFICADGRYKTNPGIGGDKKPFGVIDPEVGVIHIDNLDKTPYGAIINYACHCDCVGGTSYSSDYPGAIKERLKKMHGSQFVPVFINGFCGNLNHVDFENGSHKVPDYYITMGNRLAIEVNRTRETAEPMSSETIRGAHDDLSLATREPTAELLSWAEQTLADRDASPVDRFYANEAQRFAKEGVQQVQLVVQALRLSDVVLYGMPGEIYTEYALFLKKHTLDCHVMTANLANGCAGYVPIPELFRPGIYEARLCSSSKLVPEAGQIMSNRLLELESKLR
ncbi:MAG: hypothetical protein PHV28_06990 [Kiritimatiellae bacterium]|jgi:hypothetical protein|nr:hypothetical protein [Kiritimatiellia bacterium]